jgi:TonB family protein
MVPDDGKRVNDAAPLTADLSSDPKLLAESVVIPSYTDAALDASYEGRVTVEVFVDESGKVIQAEPKKKIGYGMDERILQSSLSAKFIPRKNRWGQAESGWSKITFNLQVP